jgi:hypothetical protein
LTGILKKTIGSFEKIWETMKGCLRKYSYHVIPIFLIVMILVFGCTGHSIKDMMHTSAKIVFLHHSTGEAVWEGNTWNIRYKAGQILRKLTGRPYQNSSIPRYFKVHNKRFHTSYQIDEMAFPKKEPYGWNNYPYDYYNIWVRHGGENPYLDEPTLEILTKTYDVVVLKHCFPVCHVQADPDTLAVDSKIKSIGNYKLQYEALKKKMHEFPDTRFILWTGAAKVEGDITEEEATRARTFFAWVKDTWDQPEDNIFLWDFYELQTDGGIYLKPEYATSETDSHPNSRFSGTASRLLYHRIIDVIENNGTSTDLTGRKI